MHRWWIALALVGCAPASESPNAMPVESIRVFRDDALEASFRDLELAMRPHGCVGCHEPDYAAQDLATVGAHVLSGRHAILQAIEMDQMPPAGITDAWERARLIELARAFAAAGDAARP